MGEVRTELGRCNFTDADVSSGIDAFLLGANAAGFDYRQGYATLGTGIFRDPQMVAGGGVAAGEYDNDGGNRNNWLLLRNL